MNFSDYPISTQTLIISTNIIVNCDQFFNSIQCQPIQTPLKGKNRMLVQNSDVHLKDGTIVFVQYKTDYKGIPFKKLTERYFLNSVTIIMKIDIKYVNIKVSNKGKLQITGCSKDEYIFIILNNFWSYIRLKPNLWSFQNVDHNNIFEAIIIPVMCNINFSLDFQINREALDMIIKTKTEYRSILEPSDGYVGVNIKINVQDEPLENVLLTKYKYSGEKYDISQLKYMDYIYTLTQKEQRKKLSKCINNTFLVFYSGKVIMSGGISKINRKKAYDIFMDILNEYKQNIISKD